MMKRITDIEKEIDKIETEIAEMDKAFSAPDNVSPPDVDFFSRYIEMKKSLSAKMAIWGEYTSELEEFKKNNE